MVTKTEQFVAGSGVGLTWTKAFSTATLNGLAFNAIVQSDLVIDNSSALDMFADLSMITSSFTYQAAAYCWMFLYPLNQDGTTYGDGRFTTAVTETPPGYGVAGYRQYFCGSFYIGGGGGATAAAQSVITGIVLPPGKLKFVCQNVTGASLPTSTNIYYRTYNRSVQ